MPSQDIANTLDVPITMVEHWFRKDACFSVPDPDLWIKLKALIRIETDEFDKSIMTFETKSGNFDTRNRIHMGSIAPTLNTNSGNTLYCVETPKAPKEQTDKEQKMKDDKNKDNNTYVIQGSMIGRKEENGPQGSGINKNVCFTLNTSDHHSVCAFAQNQRNEVRDLNDIAGALAAVPGMKQQTFICKESDHNENDALAIEHIVRRLTPMECERLQGFPDNWTNIGDWVDTKGKTHKGGADAPRYKALGNSIALPYWQWMAERMASHLPEGATMASLFDGIAGFPLVYSRAGVKPLWTSEIEEFPIAVCKKHFGDEDEGIEGDYIQYL